MKAGRALFVPLLLLALLLHLGSAPAWAEDTQLPDVSVSATRSPQELEKLPTNVTIITQKDIEAINPLTVTDLLRSVVGLVVRDYTGTGASASVDLRGFGETGALHTVVTVDGRRLNQIDLSGVDFTTIPVENIQRVEILHGPSGVLYGNGAVGGVINIMTKEGTQGFSGKVAATVGSYGLWGGRANVSGGNEKMSGFASVRYDSMDGYRDNSNTRLKNLTFNTRYGASETYSFLVDGAVSHSKYDLPGSLSEAAMNADRRQSTSPNNWADNKDTHVRGQVRADWRSAGVLTCDLSYRSRKTESRIWSIRESDIGTWGLQPKYVLEGNLGSMSHRLTTGVDYYKIGMNTDVNDLDNKAEETIDYSLSTLGVYALDELSITPKLILAFGGRYQKADYDIDIKPVGTPTASETYDDDQYALSLGLSYIFAEKSKLFARVSRSFRYPTVEEYVTYGQFTDLKPEKVLSYEIGGAYSFGQGGRATLTAYIMDLSDEIAYNQLTYTNENLDDTRHTGVEVDLKFPLWAGAHLFGNLAYMQAQFANGPFDGNDLPLVPNLKGAAGIFMQFFKGFTGSLQLDYVGERSYGNDKDNDYGKMGDYTTLGLRLRYDYNKNLGLFFNANNILGKEYSSYAYAGSWGKSFYPEPTQMFWGGVEVKF